MRVGVKRLRQRIADLEAFAASSIVRAGDPRITALEKSIEETLQRVFGAGTIELHRYVNATSLHPPISVAALSTFSKGTGQPPRGELQREFSDLRSGSIALLGQAVKGLEEEIADASEPATSTTSLAALPPDLSKVFIVHGHDASAREAIARFLEKIELEAIILHEQPDQGFTIIEKFETYAKQVGFAVVLLTPDDLGGPASAPALIARARQNVIFELGYFVGKLGRGRACLLRKREVEIPSDLYGVIYTEMDDADGWKLKLVRELQAAGLKFDADKVFG